MDSTDGRLKVAYEVIAEVVGADITTLSPDTELVADLGVDSAKALHLLVELEDRFDVEISDEVVTEMKTVGDLLSAISEYAGPAD